jgi:hypothetical protein
METEHDQFEQVQRLLALKRHEQPPPRFFDIFSRQVMARLEALEAAQRVTWWQRLGLDFDYKPAMVGALGVVVCGLLLVGVVTSLGVSQPPEPGVSLAGDPAGIFSLPPASPALAGRSSVISAFQAGGAQPSTDPVGGNPVFSRIGGQVQRTGFMLGPR